MDTTAGPVARHSLRANLLASGVGQVLTWVLTAAVFAILPRYFGPHGVGVLNLAATFSGLAAAIASLGMVTVITRDIARNRDAAGGLVATSMVINLVFGATAAVVGIGIGLAVGYSREVVVAIAISCASVPFMMTTSTAIAAFQGLEVMRYAARTDVVMKVVMLVSALVVIGVGLGINGYLWLNLLLASAAAAWQVMILRSMVRLDFRKVTYSMARYLVKASVPFLLTTVLFSLYTGVDVLLLSLFANESAIGIYAAPMRLFGTMLVVPTLITTVMFPKMATAFGSAPEEMRNVVQGTLKVTLLASIAVSIFSLAFGGQLVTMLLGDSFEQSAVVVLVFAIILLPTSISVVATRVAYASENQSFVVRLGAGTLIAKAMLGCIMIPLFGRLFDNPALGAAAGLALVEFGMMAGLLWKLRETLFDMEFGRFAIGASSAGLVAMATLSASFVVGPWIGGLLACATYAIACLAFRVLAPADIWSSLGWAAGKGSVPAFLMPSPRGTAEL